MAESRDDLVLDPRTCAFIIVDMQNDFLEGDGYFGRQGLPTERLRRAVEPTGQLRAALPPETRVVYTVQIYEPDGSDDLGRVHRLKPSGLARRGGEVPAVRGTWGAEIVPALAPRPTDVVVAKRRFDAFYQTDLDLLLRCWGIKTLIFSGVVSDVCVETSLRSAYVRDYDTILARECVAGWAEEHLTRTVEVVARTFGVSLGNAEILKALGAPGSRRSP